MEYYQLEDLKELYEEEQIFLIFRMMKKGLQKSPKEAEELLELQTGF